MSTCTPAPAILALLGQVNAAFPARSRASDGICGDARHQASVSDHNQGNAVDITRDEAHGPDLEALALALLRDPRTAYVIFRARIANPDKLAGAWRPYTGTNRHDHHLHVSIRAPRRGDPQPWPVPWGEPPPVSSASPGAVSLASGAPSGLWVIAGALGLAGLVLLTSPTQRTSDRKARA